MAGLVPAIHVFVCDVLSEVKIWMPGTKATAIRSEFLVRFASHGARDLSYDPKTWMAGHRRAEATPSFGRLCPAMTILG
jgi:hypothetical protein